MKKQQTIKQKTLITSQKTLSVKDQGPVTTTNASSNKISDTRFSYQNILSNENTPRDLPQQLLATNKNSNNNSFLLNEKGSTHNLVKSST